MRPAGTRGASARVLGEEGRAPGTAARGQCGSAPSPAAVDQRVPSVHLWQREREIMEGFIQSFLFQRLERGPGSEGPQLSGESRTCCLRPLFAPGDPAGVSLTRTHAVAQLQPVLQEARGPGCPWRVTRRNASLGPLRVDSLAWKRVHGCCGECGPGEPNLCPSRISIRGHPPRRH